MRHTAATIACSVAMLLLAACGDAGNPETWPEVAAPAQTEYPPPAGTGRVVIVLSGAGGPVSFQPIAAELAKLGYDTVLLDGNDVSMSGGYGGGRLKAAILRAQQSPSALPGKVAVVGFSLGGGEALTYATRLPDLVAVVVAWYPLTRYIETDDKAYVGGMKVPTLILAGGRDDFYDCCTIESMRALEAAARELGTPLDLVVYPEADHGFNIPSFGRYRPGDSADGRRRTAALLQQYLSE
jgi:alpha-beta hydrolase superfamily lysophospholipase